MLCPPGAHAFPLPDQVPGAQGPGIPTQMTPSLLQAHPPEGGTGRAHCQAQGKLSGGPWEAVTAEASHSQAPVSPDAGRGGKGRHQRRARPGASSHSTATFLMKPVRIAQEREKQTLPSRHRCQGRRLGNVLLNSWY